MIKISDLCNIKVTEANGTLLNGTVFNRNVFMYVLVQPAFVRVIDENSKNTLSTGATLGPINEGSTIALYCESGKGKPIPTVEWFKGDQPLEGKIYNISRLN